MELPDCEADLLDLVQLTEVQKAEMIRRLAQEGVESLDEYIEQLIEDDQAMADRFKRMRDKLARDAEKLRSKLDHQYDDELRKLEEEMKAEQSALESQQPDMSFYDDQDLYERYLEDSLSDALEDYELFDLVMHKDQLIMPKKLPWYKRFWEWIKRMALMVRTKFAKVWYWLMHKLGRREKSLEELERDYAKGRKISIHIPFKGIRSIYDKFENRFGNALVQDEKVQSVVDKKLVDNKVIRADELTLKKEIDPEGYVRMAKQMLREDMSSNINKVQDKAEKGKKESKRYKKQKAEMKKKREDLKNKLESRRKERLEEIESKMTQAPKDLVRKKIKSQLEDAGYLKQDEKKGWVITANLIERFSAIVFNDEVRRITQSGKLRYGSSSETMGNLDKAKLRSLEEENRMDIVDSVIHARIYHPRYKELDDSDIYVKREINTSAVHVVIAFDKSGSMDENNRLDAAKRATLALYKAVKQHNRRNIVDLVAFDSKVHNLSLMDVWNCQPKGFTNIGDAVKVATDLFGASKADQRLFYLVTDGMPEAYTEKGQVYAGDTDKAMEYTLKQMERLNRVGKVRFILIMLEPEDDTYLDSARKISKKVKGKMVTADPNQLASMMLTDYLGPGEDRAAPIGKKN